jgi:hypothetical protein
MKIAALLACVLTIPLSAGAQTPGSSPDFENLPIPSWTKSIADSFSKPLHPVIGGIATGGGVGVGIGYDTPREATWFQNGKAMVTYRRYWSLEGEAGRRSLSKRSQIGAFGAVRDMGRLSFYGLGPDAILGNRAAYRLRETTFGTRGWIRPVSAVRLGASVAAYIPDLGRAEEAPCVRSSRSSRMERYRHSETSRPSAGTVAS